MYPASTRHPASTVSCFERFPKVLHVWPWVNQWQQNVHQLCLVNEVTTLILSSHTNLCNSFCSQISTTYYNLANLLRAHLLLWAISKQKISVESWFLRVRRVSRYRVGIDHVLTTRPAALNIYFFSHEIIHNTALLFHILFIQLKVKYTLDPTKSRPRNLRFCSASLCYWLSERSLRFDKIRNFFFRRMYVCLSVQSRGHSFQAILMKLGTRIPWFLT